MESHFVFRKKLSYMEKLTHDLFTWFFFKLQFLESIKNVFPLNFFMCVKRKIVYASQEKSGKSCKFFFGEGDFESENILPCVKFMDRS